MNAVELMRVVRWRSGGRVHTDTAKEETMSGITAGCVQAMRDAGLDVVEMEGWQDRGESGSFNVRGILLHHDAMGLHTDNVPQYMSQNGVSGSQLWIKYTGQVYVMAAGLKWHAGAGGGFRNIPAGNGNAYCVGIETDYSGTGPRPEAIDTAIHTLTRVLVEHYGMDPARDLALHKEYAPDRKIDLSNFDADEWRSRAARTEPTKEWDEMATEAQIDAKLDALFLRVDKMVQARTDAVGNRIKDELLTDLFKASPVKGRASFGDSFQLMADRHETIWRNTSDTDEKVTALADIPTGLDQIRALIAKAVTADAPVVPPKA